MSRESNVGDCCGGLRGHGGQQFKISGGITTWFETKIDSSDLVACADQVDAGGALGCDLSLSRTAPRLLGHFTCHAYWFVEPATIGIAQPDPYPAGTDSVPDRMRESRQQRVEFGRLLHRRTEVLE